MLRRQPLFSLNQQYLTTLLSLCKGLQYISNRELFKVRDLTLQEILPDSRLLLERRVDRPATLESTETAFRRKGLLCAKLIAAVARCVHQVELQIL